MTEATERKLETFEMWLYHRMLQVSWTQRETNVEILRQIEKEVLNIVKCCKLQYLGRIMRNESRYQASRTRLSLWQKKTGQEMDILVEELKDLVREVDLGIIQSGG